MGKCFTAIVILSLSFFTDTMAQTSVGNYQSGFHQEGNTITFSNINADVQLSFCTSEMLRVRASWDRNFDADEHWMVVKYDWPKVDLKMEDKGDYFEIETSKLLLKVEKNPFSIAVYDKDEKLLISGDLGSGQPGMTEKEDSVSVRKKLFPGEHFFGFGERMDFMDQRGKKVHLNVGRGRGSHLTGAYNILEANYSPVPFFLSTRGYGIFMHNAFATDWDMGFSNSQEYSFSAAGGDLDYYFIYGPGFPSILDRYTSLTGKSPLMPKFALGLNVGTYSGGTWGHEEHASTQYVVNLGRKFREKGIPADVLHLDSTWRLFGKGGHGATTYEWRSSLENPEAMFDTLYAMGYNLVGLHIRPRYDNGPEYHLLDKARKADAIYPEPTNSGEFVNFFDSSAVNWWWNNAAMKVASQGAKFFKTDEGSAFSFKANESNKIGPIGKKAERLHNLFPIAYARAPYEKFSEYNNMRGYNLTREGYAGIQRYPYIFAGDWPSEWQYFAPVIKAGLNIGLSGVGYWGHCMGGFEHDADPELYIRWTQFGLMSSVAHLFGMDHPGYKEPWNYGDQAQKIFKKYDRLRYRLIPYIYSEAYKMYETGMPLMRALVLEYQNDANTYDISDEYMFGSNLLVAPVITKGAGSRVVYLPKGTWFDYWTGKKYEGKQYLTVVTPLEKLPIFVKGGSIIPMQKVLNLGEETADTLTIDVFPHGKSSYTLYDDDGKSMDYQQGEFTFTEITSEMDENTVHLQVHQPEGNYNIPNRTYTYRLHIRDKPQSVTADGELVQVFSGKNNFEQNEAKSGWYYDDQTHIVYVFPGSSDHEISFRL